MRMNPLILVRGGPGCSRLNLPKVEIGHTPQKPLVARSSHRTIRQSSESRRTSIHSKRIETAAITRHLAIELSRKVAKTGEAKRITNPHRQSNRSERKYLAKSPCRLSSRCPAATGRQKHDVERDRKHQNRYQRPEQPGPDHGAGHFHFRIHRNRRHC